MTADCGGLTPLGPPKALGGWLLLYRNYRLGDASVPQCFGEGERIGRDGLDIVDSEVKQRSESDVKRDKGDEKPLPLDGKLLPDERGDREGQGLGVGAKDLKDRTLTNLYNALQVYRGLDDIKTKPAAGNFAPRLDELHRTLDEVVCDAYGWEYAVLDDEEEILRRLLALNLERAE